MPAEDVIELVVEAVRDSMSAIHTTLDVADAFDTDTLQDLENLLNAIDEIAKTAGTVATDVDKVAVDDLPELGAAGTALTDTADVMEGTIAPTMGTVRRGVDKAKRILRRKKGLGQEHYSYEYELELLRDTKSVRQQADRKYKKRWPQDLREAYTPVQTQEQAIIDHFPKKAVSAIQSVKSALDKVSLDKAENFVSQMTSDVRPLLKDVNKYFTKPVMQQLRYVRQMWNKYAGIAKAWVSGKIHDALRKLKINTKFIENAVQKAKDLHSYVKRKLTNLVNKMLKAVTDGLLDIVAPIEPKIRAVQDADDNLQNALAALVPSMLHFLEVAKTHKIAPKSR